MAEEIDVQLVGREFVRHYYTVLNERPDCLHLFFTQYSSYVHGGVEKPGEELPPVRGQAAIRDKIASLQFSDCHTKVRQVDSQETVGNAVLVQVSGELSNDGEPMRRFMQTFVLVRQSPKNYYVHNDIFRYQDEVFVDVENLSDDQVEGNEARVEESESFNNGSVEESVSMPALTEIQPESRSVGQQPERVLAAAAAEPSPTVTDVKPPSSIPTSSAEDEVQLVASNPVQDNVSASPVEEAEELETTNKKKEPEKEQLPQLVPSQKPFSWASLASKNAIPASVPAAAPKPQALIKPERKTDTTTSPTPPAPLPQRNPRSGPRAEMTIAEGDRKWTPVEGDDSGKRSTFPDNQQIFVGNLPHNVTDKELLEFFEQFGSVLEVKINRKGPSTNLPNFGFVAFENTDAVAKAMKAKPLLLYGKHRINVEEKKDHSELGGRSRMNSRGRGGGYGRGGFSSRAGRGTAGHMARPTNDGGAGDVQQ